MGLSGFRTDVHATPTIGPSCRRHDIDTVLQHPVLEFWDRLDARRSMLLRKAWNRSKRLDGKRLRIGRETRNDTDIQPTRRACQTTVSMGTIFRFQDLSFFDCPHKRRQKKRFPGRCCKPDLIEAQPATRLHDVDGRQDQVVTRGVLLYHRPR